MINALKSAFYNYANFSGTAKRAEFWWFSLFSIIAWIITCIIFGHSSVITFYINAILVLPSLSVCTRRLRDINKSGWWQLLWIVFIIGWIPLIIWLSRKSKEPFADKEGIDEEKITPFLNLAKEGLNNWKAWTLGSITIIIFWQIIGFIPYAFLEEVSIKNEEMSMIFEYVISNLMFVIGLLGIFIASRVFHKKKLIKFITSRTNINYDKILIAMLILIVSRLLRLITILIAIPRIAILILILIAIINVNRLLPRLCRLTN